MIQLRRIAVLGPAVAALLLAGCSPAPAATTPATAPAATSSATPTPTPSATACPSGNYTVTSFSAVGKNGTVGEGKGGDVAVEFVNGRYEVVFDKNTPIALTLSGEAGELAVDGTIEGTYQGTGADMTFTIGSVKGSAEVRYEGMSHTLPFDQVASQLGMDGAGSATCEGDKLTLKIGKTTFEMVRAA
jgi:hypothetical protein